MAKRLKDLRPTGSDISETRDQALAFPEPMLSAPAIRENRGPGGDDKKSSDRGLIKRLRIVFAKGHILRIGWRNRSTDAIMRALLREIGR